MKKNATMRILISWVYKIIKIGMRLSEPSGHENIGGLGNPQNYTENSRDAAIAKFEKKSG
jgi:hypothetical protein